MFCSHARNACPERRCHAKILDIPTPTPAPNSFPMYQLYHGYFVTSYVSVLFLEPCRINGQWIFAWSSFFSLSWSSFFLFLSWSSFFPFLIMFFFFPDHLKQSNRQNGKALTVHNHCCSFSPSLASTTNRRLQGWKHFIIPINQLTKLLNLLITM